VLKNQSENERAWPAPIGFFIGLRSNAISWQ